MLNTTVEACKSIMLLKNGHVSVGSTSIQTVFTCPFDSVYSIIAAMYADFKEISDKIDQLAMESDFARMVFTMFQSNARAAIKQNVLLKQRNEILKRIFEGSTRMTTFQNGLVSINCSANVHYIVPLALPEELYSYVRVKTCSQCKDIVTSKRCFIDINMDSLERETIRNLNTCLLDSLLCEESSNCPKCDGPRDIPDTHFSNFIMIDLSLKYGIKEISLNEIPKQLNILGAKFALFGCIQFIGDDAINYDIDAGIGHYVSHMFRKNLCWERYDDLKSSTKKSHTDEAMKIQVLFYVEEK